MTEDIVDIQLLQIRDRSAWEALYATTCRRTYRVLFHLTAAGPAILEELNQDVWLSAIQSIDRFDATRGTAADWILGIARHKGLTFMRRTYTSRVVCMGGSGDLPEPIRTADDPLEGLERSALLRAAMESLPETWQYVMKQKYQAGLSVQEIADLTNSTFKAVESTLSRARQRLRSLMRSFISEE